MNDEKNGVYIAMCMCGEIHFPEQEDIMKREWAIMCDEIDREVRARTPEEVCFMWSAIMEGPCK